MALPKQVRKQIEESEDIHSKVYLKEEDTSEPKAEEPKEEVVEAPEPEEKSKDVSFSTTDESEESSDEPEKATPNDDIEHKYRVLQGKYKAEVPRLNREVTQLQGQVYQLQSLLAQMQSRTAVSEKEDTSRQPAGTTERLIKPEEIDDFGEDLIDVVGRRAQEVVSPELHRLKSELQELREKFGTVESATVQSRTEQVHALLSREVEDWQELNTDANFLEWLRQNDPFSGEQRINLLQRAYQSGDGPRVVRFFKSYLDENATMMAPSQGSAPAQTRRQPKIDTEDLVQPGKARQTSAGAPKDKRTWTRQQISAFYRDVQTGKYRGDPDAKSRIERDIINAGAEGRIAN